MRRRPADLAAGLSALALLAAAPAALAAAPPASCGSLAAMSLPDTKITSAVEVSDGHPSGKGLASLTGLPAFCRISAVTRPAVKFEVWLPLTGWNGKFQGVGNGANGGFIAYPAMAAALRRGYAAASTDTGHETDNPQEAAWALGHPELLIDFGYRSVHVMTENAKRIVAQFYAQPARHAFFVACSTGGRQALMEAQRFPGDYDGIVAGAPAFNWTHFYVGGHMWVADALNRDPESYIPAAKLKAIGDGVNAACDRLDGIADGVLADPRRCTLDARKLQCPAGRDDASCLTPKQAAALNAVWNGPPRDARGRQVYPGFMRGGEASLSSGSGGLGWDMSMVGTGPMSGGHWDLATKSLKYMVFENPDWDFRTLNVARDTAFAEKKVGGALDATNPDLSGFQKRGGRMILYHGWSDPGISPQATINYYESLVAREARKGDPKSAQARTEDFARLFMAPGMMHCGGGPGPSNFDMVTALEQWVEEKKPPQRIIASHLTAGVVDRTRPLCAYPKTAAYTGRGSTDAAANFECKAPRSASPTAGKRKS